MEVFPYKEYDGLGLAELIKSKQVKPIEVLQEAIKQIEKQNPSLNAVINKMYDHAENSLGSINYDSPFAAVPMLLKDITQEIAGEKITSGSKSLQGYTAKDDSAYVAKARETGVVFVGQTNVPEFALMGTTEPAFYGPTRNPWNMNHTPGGSSGGSAAAVASGMVPIAGANDGGGSIRIPAAYCGLFGIKPSRGRTPAGPIFGRHWQGASVDHVLTRTVRDSAAMLDELHGYEKAAAFHARSFEGTYLKICQAPLERKLKIAYTIASPIGTKVDAECKLAVNKAAALLESLGHFVEEKEAPVDGSKIAKSYLTMYFGEVAATLASLESVLGRKAKMTDVEPTTWLLGLLGKVSSAEEFVLAIREWDKAAIAMEAFHETYDLYLTPATACPPAIIGELEPSSSEKFLIKTVGSLGLGSLLKKSGIIDQIAENSLKRTPFTQLANLTGQPAMSVPLHLTPDGLPIGVQLIAGRGGEDLLFQLAGQLEQTESWLDVKENPLFSR
ncbi:amidase [Peribacillus saganii]|uniref:Amidase n=1 Tax=Peribacillus saganii TaxID=2303992 RepID=A0A372LRW4_9BACI|nr:amidase family protein [Peribacillus saganii]RFU70933.1 amidase [Peribacillus saganii]